MQKRPKIMVAGGCGFIGSHILVELVEQGYSVVSVDNHCNSSPVAIERVKRILGEAAEHVHSYHADVRSGDELRAIFSQHTDIRAVIHCASLKAVGESMATPLRYYENNLNTSISLLEVMREFQVKTVVFSSSATVYGVGDGFSPKVETQEHLNPTNPYGRTKLFIEEIMKDVCVSDPSFQAILLRYFNPVGAHPSGLIGEDPQGVPNNLMPYVLQVASGRRAKVSVFGDDYKTEDGTGARDYIHVVDLAKGHVTALEKLRGQTGSIALNLGSGRCTTVLQLIASVSKACGRDIPYEITARRAGDMDILHASPKKAAELLGWTTQLSIDDMCRDGWNWQQLNPMGYETQID